MPETSYLRSLVGDPDSDMVVTAIHASAITGVMAHVRRVGGDFTFWFEDALSQSDEDALDALLASQFDELTNVRYRRWSVLDAYNKSVIFSLISQERQVTLIFYFFMAMLTGLTNRAAYIQPLAGWLDSILGYYYGRCDALNAATTVAEVNAVTWDYAPYRAGFPSITISGAMGIPD